MRLIKAAKASPHTKFYNIRFCLHGARFMSDLVGAISPDPPPKKSNCSSHPHGKDFNAMLAYDCNSQKSLTLRDCVPVILAKSRRRKNRYRTGSLTRCEIVLKRGLLVLNLQKPTAAKALQMRRLSVVAFETITLRSSEKKLYEASASIKRNTANTIKQLISLKLAMKIQGKRWSSKRSKSLKKAYLLCIILNWLGWRKVKWALMLIIYYKILSFTF